MNNKRIKRFTLVERMFHMVLILCFLIQAGTGLARMCMETGWGGWLAGVFGGYESALVIHKNTGIIMLAGLLAHIIYLFSRIKWRTIYRSLAGPDSLVPGVKDLKHFFQHIGWFFGRSHPRFDRWGYWEKFDYWAVFWGMAIIGATGVVLAWPLAACRIMPGWGLNVALWIHRIEALLAMGHVFIIHFFIAHLRRHNFPMDLAIFEGSADMAAMKHEKPAWIERLESEGKLNPSMTGDVHPARRVLFHLFGYAAVFAGIFLLVGALANLPHVTW